jgi:hypothetical protein
MDPVMTWGLLLLGMFIGASPAYIFGAAITRRKMESNIEGVTKERKVAERRMVAASELVDAITQVVESEYRALYPTVANPPAPREMIKVMRGEIETSRTKIEGFMTSYAEVRRERDDLRDAMQKILATKKVVKA